MKQTKVMDRPVNNGRSSATGFTVVSPTTSVVSLTTSVVSLTTSVVSLMCSLTYFHLINVLKTEVRLFDSLGEKSSKRKRQPESSH